eukprot:Gb_13428 [translate_table: standard]
MGKIKSFCCSCFSSAADPNVNASANAPPITSPGSASVPHDVIPSAPTPSPQSALIEPILKAANHANSSDIDLDALISHISHLLAAIKNSSEKNPFPWQWPTSSDFSELREFVVEGSDLISKEKESLSKLSGDAKTVAMSILKGIGEAHWAAAGLLVVSSILERFESISANNTECLQLLEAMSRLALHIKHLKDRTNLKEGMGDTIQEAVSMIVQGSILCCTQMKSSKFSKFFRTSMNSEELLGLRSNLDDMYTRLMLQMGICIYDAINNPKTSLPRQNAYPHDAVGLEEQFYKVIQLLELQSETNAVAVILHGFGGMGKTTLADAIFARLDIEDCKFSTIRLFENTESVPDITKLQTWILQDLTSSKESVPDIRRFEDGRRLLSDILEKEQAFIYIDNVLKKDQLQKLLPKKLDNSKKLRLLLTARNEYIADVLKLCGIKTCIYSVEPLVSKAAKEFFKGLNIDEIASEEIHKILDICNGIPLMLAVVGGYIFSSENKDEAYSKVIEWHKSGKAFSVEEEDNLETNGLNFAFEDLPASLKDPFHDICSFFTSWDWDKVAAIVGQEELISLKKRALLRKEESNKKVNVHDVILRIGLNQTKGKRFTTADGLREALEDNKDIQGIKGIWLQDNMPEPFHIPAAQLDSMHNSLRILALGGMTFVDGKCTKKFEQVIYFQAGFVPNIPFDITTLKELRFLKYIHEENKNLNLSKMPSKLKVIKLDGQRLSPPFEITREAVQKLHNLQIFKLKWFDGLKKLPEEISFWGRLKELVLSGCKSIEELPNGLGELNALQKLNLHNCQSLKQLPESFEKLQSLKKLDLSYCYSLTQLPSNFGSLISLQEVNLDFCNSLKELPHSFQNLSSLLLLNLNQCSELLQLPDGLGNLKSLVHLHMEKCENLRSIPDSFGQLTSLAVSLKMNLCRKLTELPDGFCNLTFVKDLSFARCFALHKLPKRLIELVNLRRLNLEHCTQLSRLPEGFGELLSLEELDLSGCYSLEELSTDFHCLPSLQNLDLRKCRKLEGKWMESIVKIKTLEFVDIQGSEMLVEGWGTLAKLHGSWHLAVRTGQDLDNVDNILNKLASRFFSDEWLLTDSHGEPFCSSTLATNTVLLVMLDSDPSDSQAWPWLEKVLLEEVQITSDNFQLIYVGQHFTELPISIKERILAYASYNSMVVMFFNKALSIFGNKEYSDLYYDKTSSFFISMKVGEDERGYKSFSSWKDISQYYLLKEFILSRSETYLYIKNLVETNSIEGSDSHVKLLGALLQTPEEPNSPLIKNSTEKMSVDDLQGKLILLLIGGAHDHPFWSLTEMYVESHDGYNYEIVSIPIRTEQDWYYFEGILNSVPWPVISNPRSIKSGLLYFFEKDWKYSPFSPILVVVEPNGRISNKNALPMVERLGVEAHPFTLTPSVEDKLNKQKVADWDQLKHMSSIEFLFQTLESRSKIKETMLQRKMIFLYSVYSGWYQTPELSYASRELGGNIQVIHIGNIFDTSGQRMEGIPSLELSVKDTNRLWTRVSYLRSDIEALGDTQKLQRMRSLLESFYSGPIPIYCEGKWMIIIDEDGELVTGRGWKVMELLCQKSEKDEELIKELIQCFKEGKKAELKRLIEKNRFLFF